MRRRAGKSPARSRRHMVERDRQVRSRTAANRRRLGRGQCVAVAGAGTGAGGGRSSLLPEGVRLFARDGEVPRIGNPVLRGSCLMVDSRRVDPRAGAPGQRHAGIRNILREIFHSAFGHSPTGWATGRPVQDLGAPAFAPVASGTSENPNSRSPATANPGRLAVPGIARCPWFNPRTFRVATREAGVILRREAFGWSRL